MGYKIRFLISTLSASALLWCATASAETSTNAMQNAIKNALLGKQLPYNSKKMVALVSYLTSLSQGKKINIIR